MFQGFYFVYEDCCFPRDLSSVAGGGDINTGVSDKMMP